MIDDANAESRQIVLVDQGTHAWGLESKYVERVGATSETDRAQAPDGAALAGGAASVTTQPARMLLVRTPGGMRPVVAQGRLSLRNVTSEHWFALPLRLPRHLPTLAGVAFVDGRPVLLLDPEEIPRPTPEPGGAPWAT